MTHKSEDYKISAVKYYLNNKESNIRKTCKIFDCKKSTLQRWVKRYETSKISQEKIENLFHIRLLNNK